MLRKWLQGLSLTALGNGSNKRRLQEELDLHRLYLLTKWFAEGGEPHQDAAEGLDREARELGLEGTRAAVSGYVVQQTLDVCRALHAVLEAAGDSAYASRQLEAQRRRRSEEQRAEAPPRRGLGASMAPSQTDAPGADGSRPPHGDDARRWGRRLTQREVSDALALARGFTLDVAASSVPHAESGDGLWLRGRAGVGQVVALYPGVAYLLPHHRQIPGYPLVARTNPYLLSRFDATVLDAKPWGTGGVGSGGGGAADHTGWPLHPQNEAERALAQLEGRHPLALAHMANHPPAGTLPNVVVAGFDVDLRAAEAPAELRAYLPTVVCAGAGAVPSAAEPRVPGVALVATRALQDEELFFNYRLNPNAPAGLPGWYHSVCEEEDARRWS